MRARLLRHVPMLLVLGCGGGSTVVTDDGGVLDGGATNGVGGDGGTGTSTDGGGAESGPGAGLCTPGGVVFCRCSNRDEGTKTCAADGRSFDLCTTATGPCPP